MPNCREPRTELAHIVPWATVRKHEASNLIALCPTDHARFDAGEIPRQVIEQIKANQAVLSSRYTELERRVLQWFGRNPTKTMICLDWSSGLMYESLLLDGFLEPEDPDDEAKAMKMTWADEGDEALTSPSFSAPFGPRLLRLTAKGKALVDRVAAAEAVE
jgi:hypothetical protein